MVGLYLLSVLDGPDDFFHSPSYVFLASSLSQDSGVDKVIAISFWDMD
jgi:hypothetical protein